MNVVISQPMLFPWVGMFEQIKLANIYVHLGDVQFSKGSFTNRVQLKTPEGMRWMTLPTEKIHLGQRIDEIRVNNEVHWRTEHLDMLQRSYAEAEFCEDMLELVSRVHNRPCEMLSDVAKDSIEVVCDYFGLLEETRFVESRTLSVPGKGAQRVLDIVMCLSGDTYITGHGASNYLDHSIFEDEGITVEYMDYKKAHYPQLHGDFTPYVSVLDLVANVGPEGRNILCSGTINWKDFI